MVSRDYTAFFMGSVMTCALNLHTIEFILFPFL